MNTHKHTRTQARTRQTHTPSPATPTHRIDSVKEKGEKVRRHTEEDVKQQQAGKQHSTLLLFVATLQFFANILALPGDSSDLSLKFSPPMIVCLPSDSYH